MYCSGCGQTVAASQAVCPRCGRPVAALPVQAAYPARGPGHPAAVYVARCAYRVQRHVQTLGGLWIAFGVWTALQALLAATFFTGMFGPWGHRWGMGRGPFEGGFPFSNMPWLVPLFGVLTAGRVVVSVVTGYGLLGRVRWARTLALVTAFLTLLKPVTGTILAIYTLWVLLPAASGYEYDQISEP